MSNFLPAKLFVGATLCAGMLMGSMATAEALVDSQYIYGIKDTGGEALLGANGGWTVHTEYIGMDKTGGKDFTKAANISNVVTLNYGHYYNQVPGNFDAADGHFPNKGEKGADGKYVGITAYAERVADYISNSKGVNYWVIGDEFNKPRTWPGATNDEMYGGTGDWMRSSLYAEYYKEIYDAVKAVAPDAKLAPAATAPFSPPKSPNDQVRGYINYWTDCLEAIGADKIDALPFKAYSHDANVSNVTSESKWNDGPYQGLYYDFQSFRDFMAAIPEDMKDKPTMITETHQYVGSANYMTSPRTCWKDEDNGWVEAMYAEINNWNENNDQQILFSALHRWNKVPDDVWTFGISDLEGVKKGLQDAVVEGYTWNAVPEPASLMLLGLGGLALLRRRA